MFRCFAVFPRAKDGIIRSFGRGISRQGRSETRGSAVSEKVGWDEWDPVVCIVKTATNRSDELRPKKTNVRVRIAGNRKNGILDVDACLCLVGIFPRPAFRSRLPTALVALV